MKVLVYCELENGKATDLTLQSLTVGKQISSGDELFAALLTNDASPADELLKFGVDRVFCVEDDLLSEYSNSVHKKAMLAAIEASKPDLILFPATTSGNDLAPSVATVLNSPCVLDCTAVDLVDGGLRLGRLEFDGKVITRFMADGVPVVASLKDGIADPAAEGDATGEIIRIDAGISESDLLARVIRSDVAARTVDLKAANIIVAGGAGVGSRENFALIEELARVLGGEVGATRAAVDAGWAGNDRQIGQTGVTVKPDLYIACGISGAVQHRVGILGAKTIVAINIDPNAPIFRFAHYKIVGDLTEVLPRLIKLAKER